MQVKKAARIPGATPATNRPGIHFRPVHTPLLPALHQSSLPSILSLQDRRFIMQDMSVQATVPGGQQMVVNIGGQQMQVMVPMGVQPGQNFTFSVPAPQQPAMAMAQPMMAPPMMQPAVAMGQPVMPQPPISPMMAQPQQVIMMPAGASGPIQHGMGGSNVPPGAPPGGSWVYQNHCGENTLAATIIVAILFTPAACCVPCCKCDRKRSPAFSSLASFSLIRSRHALPSRAPLRRALRLRRAQRPVLHAKRRDRTAGLLRVLGVTSNANVLIL